MTDIFDYLYWRGDLSTEQIPMNAVDGMVLARMSYLPFEYAAPLSAGKSVTVAEAAKALLSQNDLDEKIRQKSDIPLLEALTENHRFGDIAVSDCTSTIDTETQTQFAASTFHMADCSVCVSFRGTDNTLVGWKEDFNMSFVCPVPGQARAVEYLERIAARYTGELTVVGHSKGGNLAVYAAAFCRVETQNRIRAVFNYDGPGFDDKVLQTDGYRAICNKVGTFVPQSSVVGMLLGHEEKYTIIHSEQLGIMQHDIFSWEVGRDGFACLTAVDNSSRFINYTLKAWIAEMDYKQRETFIDAIYAVLTETHAGTLDELSENWFENARTVIKSLKSLDEPTRKALSQAITLLAKSAKEGLAQLWESDKQEQNN